MFLAEVALVFLAEVFAFNVPRFSLLEYDLRKWRYVILGEIASGEHQRGQGACLYFVWVMLQLGIF